MNPLQRGWLIASLVAFGLMGMFPPWLKPVVKESKPDFGYNLLGNAPNQVSVVTPATYDVSAGYGFVFAPSRENGGEVFWRYGDGERIDFTRLLAQWAVLAAFATANH